MWGRAFWILLLLVTGLEGQTGFSESLVGYWKMDFIDGSVVYDETDYFNNGSASGATFIASGGIFDGAISFDGGDWINVGNQAELRPSSNEITVASWFNVSSSVGQFQHPVAFWKNYHIRIGKSLEMIRFTVFTGSTEVWAVYNNPVLTGEWYHVVGTYDGSTARLYLDGVEVSSNTLGITLNTNASYPFSIGDVSWGRTERFRGLLDEVAVWNRALSSDEIGLVYRDGVETFELIPEPCETIFFCGFATGIFVLISRKRWCWRLGIEIAYRRFQI